MLTINLLDGLLFSLISILVVISIIGLIILSIQPLKKLSHKENPVLNKTEEPTKMNEDMIVALLVASIDFKETEKKIPKLKSIKEITYENI
jgi:hypothetical protein